MAIQVLTPGQTRTRVNRRPSFPIAGGIVPYGLYPVMIHPVLPGETLESATIKIQMRSRPIKNPLAGCWLEFWLAYVKFTDLDRELGEMFISDTYSSSGHTASSDNARTFTKTGQIDWVGKCLNRIHDAYFVNDSETPRTIDGVPQVKLNQTSWMQNMMFKPADETLVTADTFDTHQQLSAWMMLQQMQMDEITYEEYLRQYGVQSIRTNVGDPEILRYARSWTLPRNEINPEDGSPASAWLWRDDITLDKPKRFDEPGFVIALACARPKMFNAGHEWSMVGNLWGFSDWFPAYNLTDPTMGIKEMANNDPVFSAAANGDGTKALLFDQRDMLSHGEQFLNGNHPWALPLSTAMSVDTGAALEDIRHEYCTLENVKDIFTAEATVADYCIAYDGLASLRIAGHIKDTTR